MAYSSNTMLAYDRSVRSYDKEGRLHILITPISKANICPYFGREIPGGFKLGLEPDRIYQMFRAPDELAKGAQSSNNIQLLEMHIGVTARDPKKQETVGSTGTDAVFDAPYLKNSLVIWDKAAIDLIESDRKKELSCSYSYVADMTPGTYLGLKYDGIMRDIAFNHVALVKDGRAGADVLVEDSLPLLLKRSLVRMPNNVKLATSRKALVARGALVAFISPKLANDAQIDYSKILKGITAENWVENRPVLLSRIKIATNGKLANDEDLEGMDGVLKMLDKTGEDEKDEEEETEEEKKEREAKDKRARDRRARDKRARDNETEDEREEREAEDRRARDEKEEEEKREKEAKDKRARDEEREKEKAEDKKAMDAAIGAAVGMERKRQAELNEALRAVRPLVGELAIAFDSAEDVFKKVLEMKGAKIVDVHPSAYRALIDMLPKVSGTRPEPRLAMDAAHADLAKKYAPSINSIRVGT